MCNNFFFDQIELNNNVVLLEQQFVDLERKMGGSGNGIATLRKGHTIVQKGQNYGCTEATVDTLTNYKEGGRLHLFHTRFRTVGSLDEAQPFKEGKVLLAHNGTVRAWAWHREYSDSHIAAIMTGRLDMPLTELADTTSSWIGWKNNRAFVIVSFNFGMEMLVSEDGQAWCVSSVFDNTFVRHALKQGFKFHILKNYSWMECKANDSIALPVIKSYEPKFKSVNSYWTKTKEEEDKTYIKYLQAGYGKESAEHDNWKDVRVDS
jgi:hypothetical protein